MLQTARPVAFILLAAATTLGASSVAGGAPAKAPERPVTVVGPPTVPAAGPPGVPTPPPPSAGPKGWPSTILAATLGTAAVCARAPRSNEVILFRDASFAGPCAILVPGFYPNNQSLAIGDNSASSIKVGSAVRARVFQHEVYGGDWNAYAPNTNAAALGAFQDTISSMRVELASRSLTCNDVRPGEIALYRNSYRTGDCVVLSGAGVPGDQRTGAPPAPSYPTPESMGIGNDTISSIHNFSAYVLVGYGEKNFNGRFGIDVAPRTAIETMPSGGWFTAGINDHISSVQLR